MEKDEIEYIVKRSLRDDFDNSDKDRMIEIYKVSKALGHEEEAAEMKSDLISDYNLKID